jgi:hypothetical protein
VSGAPIASPPDAQNVTHCWKIREVPSSPRFAPVPVDVLLSADQVIKSELMSAFWHGTGIRSFWINAR